TLPTSKASTLVLISIGPDAITLCNVPSGLSGVPYGCLSYQSTEISPLGLWKTFYVKVSGTQVIICCQWWRNKDAWLDYISWYSTLGVVTDYGLFEGSDADARVRPGSQQWTATCPPDFQWIPEAGNCYLASPGLVFQTWTEAALYCMQRSSTLVSLNDTTPQVDMARVLSLAGVGTPLALGGWTIPTGNWSWFDGSPLDPNAWGIAGIPPSRSCLVLVYDFEMLRVGSVDHDFDVGSDDDDFDYKFDNDCDDRFYNDCDDGFHNDCDDGLYNDCGDGYDDQPRNRTHGRSLSGDNWGDGRRGGRDRVLYSLGHGADVDCSRVTSSHHTIKLSRNLSTKEVGGETEAATLLARQRKSLEVPGPLLTHSIRIPWSGALGKVRYVTNAR
ncbi:unnamed protein product, partial [Darwinula stevensoni]